MSIQSMGKSAGLALVVLLMALAGSAQALEQVTLNRPVSPSDHRPGYAELLLVEVMERTKAEFGPYRIVFGPVHMERARLLEGLREGKLANLASAPADRDWTAKLQAIEIPIDLGLQSWRIALIDKRQQERIRGLASPRSLRAGANSQWVSYAVLKDNGFHLVPGTSYEGLFSMLMAGRFDYFPRGLNEIFDEFKTYKAGNPGLAIEDSFVLHDHVPSYFFVAPDNIRLAQRIRAGMEAMLRDGALERFMLRHYRDAIAQAHLCERKVIDLPNRNLPDAVRNRAELWFDPLDPRKGFCPRLQSGSRS